jgi:hypothetical protein
VDLPPDSQLVRIASKAFAVTGITGDVFLRASLTQLELEVFEECKNLRSFNLRPDSQQENLCQGAFQKSSVVSLVLAGIRNLADEVMFGCESLQSVKLAVPGQTKEQRKREIRIPAKIFGGN